MSLPTGQTRCAAGIANCRCDIQLDLGDGVFMCFVHIPAGEFLMGSRGAKNFQGPVEEPAHRVAITEGFWLATTPVTQRQFAVWTAFAGEEHKNHFAGNEQHPAENMTWSQADDFCHWLSGRLERESNTDPLSPRRFNLRAGLATEAQWEYACSAWQELGGAVDPARRLYTEFHTGDGEETLDRAGWFGGNSGNTTHPVGQKVANRHGLHDMHGNVWEWCRDAYAEEAYRWRQQGVTDPVQKLGVSSAYRVLRGGSSGNTAVFCRAAFRSRHLPDVGYRGHGFRAGLFPERGRGVIR